MSKLATLPSDKYLKTCLAIDGFRDWVKTQPLFMRRARRPKPTPVQPQPEIDAATVAAELLESEPLPPGKKPRPGPPAGEKRTHWSSEIVQFLAVTNRPATTAEITAGLGLPETKQIRVSNALQSMRSAGKVEEAGRQKTPGRGKALVLWKLKKANKEQSA